MSHPQMLGVGNLHNFQVLPNAAEWRQEDVLSFFPMSLSDTIDYVGFPKSISKISYMTTDISEEEFGTFLIFSDRNQSSYWNGEPILPLKA